MKPLQGKAALVTGAAKRIGRALALSLAEATDETVRDRRLDAHANDRDAVFDILIARSMAASFWSWATASAAEYGCGVRISI